MPVGTALSPAACSSSITRSGDSGVAISISPAGARPSTASRTQPPTKRTSLPPALSAAMTALVAGSVIQGWGDRVSMARFSFPMARCRVN